MFNIVSCLYIATDATAAASVVSFHYIEHNSNFCHAFKHTQTRLLILMLPLTQNICTKRSRFSLSLTAATAVVVCIKCIRINIFNKTNRTIYQLKRDERIEIEWIRVSYAYEKDIMTFILNTPKKRWKNY